MLGQTYRAVGGGGTGGLLALFRGRQPNLWVSHDHDLGLPYSVTIFVKQLSRQHINLVLCVKLGRLTAKNTGQARDNIMLSFG